MKTKTSRPVGMYSLFTLVYRYIVFLKNVPTELYKYVINEEIYYVYNVFSLCIFPAFSVTLDSSPMFKTRYLYRHSPDFFMNSRKNKVVRRRSVTWACDVVVYKMEKSSFLSLKPYFKSRRLQMF